MSEGYVGKLSNMTSRILPKFVQEEHPQFVTFVTKFFEYLERKNGEYDIIANLANIADVDQVIDDFSYFYKETYSKGFPEVMEADFRFLVKQLKTFYSAKGTEKSIEFLFRTIFNTNVKFYYPKVDILRVSDGKWHQPLYLVVGRHAAANAPVSEYSYIDWKGNKVKQIDLLGLIDHKIQGVTSGATAYVDSRYLLSLQYPDILKNYSFSKSDLEWTTNAGSSQVITDGSLKVTRNANITTPSITKTIVGLEENKKYQFIITTSSITDNCDIKVTINGTDTIISNADVKKFGSKDIMFDPVQGGDDVISISIVGNNAGTANANFDTIRLTVQGVTYPKYTLSLSDVEGTFLPDEEIKVLNKANYPNFKIVRPIYDIENGIVKPTGSYFNNDGFLSYKKYIQDSNYYQEFSYELRSDIQPQLYYNVIKEMAHPAGFKMFGKLDVETLRFVSLNDLKTFNTWLISWTQNQLLHTANTNGNVTSTFNTTERERLVSDSAEYDYNQFIEKKNEVEWYYTKHNIFDHYTFKNLEALVTENQMWVFVDGKKLPFNEYKVKGKLLTFNTAPTNSTTNNIEVYPFVGKTQDILPTIHTTTTNTTKIVYDHQEIKNHTDRMYVFIDGVFQNKNIYTFESDGIRFNNTIPSGKTVDICIIKGMFNRDNYPIDNTSRNKDFYKRFSTMDNNTITHNQSIDNTNRLDNFLLFINGIKQPSSRLFMWGDSDFKLMYKSNTPTDINLLSLYYKNANNYITFNGDGTRTEFGLSVLNTFHFKPDFGLVKQKFTNLVTNSEFKDNLDGWYTTNNSHRWYNGSFRGISKSESALYLSQTRNDLKRGDIIRIEAYVKGLNADAISTFGVSGNGFNNLSSNEKYGKRIKVSNDEEYLLEIELEVNADNKRLLFYTKNMIEVQWLRVWKVGERLDNYNYEHTPR